MNERIRELAEQARQIGEYVNYGQIRLSPEQFEQKFAELIVKECINCCNEVAEEADAMKDSKFVTDAGRMLHEGMWGGATNSAITIKNRFGVKE